MNFNSPAGRLERIFVSSYETIDKYAKTGSLWTWGWNGYGNLGNETLTSESAPIQTIAGGTNWKQVSIAAREHTAAIKTDGTLWVWGKNLYGQLGDGTTNSKSSPIQTIAGGTNWKQVDCGNETSAAIKTDGTLWLWGYNSNGELGDNTRVNKSSPVQTIAGGNNWKQVSCGQYHTASVKTDGTLWTWGSNYFGTLGNGTSFDSFSSPIQTISGGTNWKQVSCGSGHTSAIKTDGTLWIWGVGIFGILGNNSTDNKNSPVQTVAGGTNWKQVSCGHYHTLAIKTDGTLWTWGLNGDGQLGDNSSEDKSSPVQTVAGGTNWKQAVGGQYHTAAIKTNGTLWTWGHNASNGELGDNTRINKSSPVQTTTGGTNWKQVSCGWFNTSATYFYDSEDLYPLAPFIPPPPTPFTNFASTENGATIGDGVVDGSDVDSIYIGPDCYEYSMNTAGDWNAVGCIFNDSSNVDSSLRSTKNTNSGTTFVGGGSSLEPFNIVIDLGQVRTFNHARYYQMFSDGKTTHAALDVSSTGDMETYDSANWTQLHDYVILDDSPTSEGVFSTFTPTTARYLRLRIYNDGSYGDSSYTELYNFKLFNI